jgi:hypothetical protein
MTSLMLAFLMQFLVSAEAGRVNHVEGDVNVEVNENVVEGAPVHTGAGYVEILLNPGSFLRLGPNSEVIIEETDLADIRVRVVSGVAVVEAGEILEEFPITVDTGDLETSVLTDGIYKFEDGYATVLEGELDIPGADVAYEKGWTVSFDRLYRAIPARDPVQSRAELWSESRAAFMARANAEAYRGMISTARGRPGYFPSSRSWYWFPGVSAWAYVPIAPYHSPYGHSYYSVVDVNRALGGGGVGTGGVRPAANPVPSSAPGGGGGSSGGGQNPPAPPPPAFGDIVPAKSGPGAQQPN